MKILVTAFDPFGGESVNAAAEVLAALPAPTDGAELVKLTVPTVFGRAAEVAVAEAERCRPDAILCLGQAGTRSAVTPERTAVNIMDARIPDNDGAQPVDEPVIPGGPAAYFSTLPVREMVAAIRAAGVPAELSESAGTFVCNSLMYAMLHYTHAHRPDVPCGFVHIPRLNTQASDAPGISRADAVKAVGAAIRSIIKNAPER